MGKDVTKNDFGISDTLERIQYIYAIIMHVNGVIQSV